MAARKKATKKKATKKKATRKAVAKKATKKAASKKATKKAWGGKRKGAGRPKGSGTGRSPEARYNRVAVMFNNAEIQRLRELAGKKGVPVSTLAYDLAAKGLKRA